MSVVVPVNNHPIPALKHGVLSRHLLLESENLSEYTEVVEALRQEYLPGNFTEQHLVEELAGIVWRKRRLRFAETAYYRKVLEDKHDSYGNATAKAALIYTHTETDAGKFNLKNALASSPAENQQELAEITTYREPALKALAFLESKRANYNKAIKMLATVTREWWMEEKLGEEISPGKKYEACVEHLHSFLLFDVVPFYNQQHEEVTHRETVKQQAEGETFIPGDQQERFNRYEVHLDRKFERTLTILLRLQEIRKNKDKALPDSEIS